MARQKRLSLVSVAVFLLIGLENVASAQDVTVNDNLRMHDSTSTVGNVFKDGVRFIHNFGTNNTFLGSNAGNLTMSGVENTAVGSGALQSNANGNANTGVGFRALFSSISGGANTAMGQLALLDNLSGNSNTAVGFQTLWQNVDGNYNTALGIQALASLTYGSGNTAIGQSAGYFLQEGSNNIYVANGSGGFESNTIRIGEPTVHTRFFAAGIRGALVSPNYYVCIDDNSQLGVCGITGASSDVVQSQQREIQELRGRLEALERVMGSCALTTAP